MVYGSLGNFCPVGKVIENEESCSDAFKEISNQYHQITPTVITDSNLPHGCGLVSGSDLVFNTNRSGGPNNTVVPLCNR